MSSPAPCCFLFGRDPIYEPAATGFSTALAACGLNREVVLIFTGQAVHAVTETSKARTPLQKSLVEAELFGISQVYCLTSPDQTISNLLPQVEFLNQQRLDELIQCGEWFCYL